MPFGAAVTAEGVRFRLWAPDAAAVTLALSDGNPLDMVARPDGWFECVTATATAGSRYRFMIDGIAYPDPASRWQPETVTGPSAVVDPTAFAWSDDGWRGRPWDEAVIYELHTGAFSATGDFAGIVPHLAGLAHLGVTLIELMPVAECAGRWNWGYDGVLPFAPATRYGGPDALKHLVEACHQRGIGVILDVVYNHFGPEGNFLHAYAERFFTDRHHTPWGAAINFDDQGARNVRDFFIHNALYWLEEFHLDGLRFDAVHAIADDSPEPFLVELGARIRAEFPDRPVHLIVENDRNDAALLGHGAVAGGPYDAQWNDDFHHAMRVLTSGATGGYFIDYNDHPAVHLARALAEGFSYQGETSRHRDGQHRGSRSNRLPPTAFVNFIQNHDQIGNHAFGWRLDRFTGPEAIDAATAILLLSPAIPLLFMGQEWGADQPFPFFCDFTGALADAVRQGRLAEFSAFPEFSDIAQRDRIPDPVSAATFLSAKLDWTAADEAGHRRLLAFHRDLLERRRARIVPLLKGASAAQATFAVEVPGGIHVQWRFGGGRRLTLVANLATTPLIPAPWPLDGVCLYQSHDATGGLPPWFVAFHLIEEGETDA